MSSPVKSLSIRKGPDGFSIHKKLKKNSYKSVADFWLEIDCFLRFDDPRLSGYLFNVHKEVGDSPILQ